MSRAERKTDIVLNTMCDGVDRLGCCVDNFVVCIKNVDNVDNFVDKMLITFQKLVLSESQKSNFLIIPVYIHVLAIYQDYYNRLEQITTDILGFYLL